MSDLNPRMQKQYEIWGRNCSVDIVFECYKGEVIDATQEAAFHGFEENLSHYAQTAFNAFEGYCAENYGAEIGGSKFDNIFKYIVPKEIYFRKNKNRDQVFGMICHFKFDEENGIAVKFVNHNVDSVGSEMILG